MTKLRCDYSGNQISFAIQNNIFSQNHPDGNESTVENLQRKIRRLESELDKRVEKKDGKDDRDKVGWLVGRSVSQRGRIRCHAVEHGQLLISQAKEEVVRWEEGKKWQGRMERMKILLKEKERESESLSKQLGTLKELYAR